MTASIMFSAVLGILGQAQGDTHSKLSTVSVYVSLGIADLNLRLPCAERSASAMFERTGVRICWRRGQPKPLPGELPIVIEISPKAPSTVPIGALAYARPYEGEHIRIFWDRIQQTVEDSRITSLLAHVMAHEITHILEGTTEHSEEGVMKAHWTCKDLSQIISKPLPFGREDLMMIRAGLATRTSRLESAPAANTH